MERILLKATKNHITPFFILFLFFYFLCNFFLFSDSIAGKKKDYHADWNASETSIIVAHQDDELLWLRPFWDYADSIYIAAYPVMDGDDHDTYKSLVNDINKIYPSFKNKWKGSMHGFVSKELFANNYLKNRCLLNPEIISKETIKNAILSKLPSNIKRIITHNNWGEYGHWHHKLVNECVREIAVERKLDVWMSALVVKNITMDNRKCGERKPDIDLSRYSYVNLKGHQLESFTLVNKADVPQIIKLYHGRFFAIPFERNSCGDFWSWPDSGDQYPRGKIDFIKIVDAGKDFSDNSVIKRTLDEFAEINIGKCVR